MTTVDAALDLFTRLTKLTDRRSLSERRSRWYHDARMVFEGLNGRSPAPFTRRPGLWRGAPSPVAPGLQPRLLRVESIVHETPDAVSLTLLDPTGVPVLFEPGQFVTLLFDLDGETHRRAYSASNTPETATPVGSVRVTVKRLAGGRVSNHIHSQLRPGDVLRTFGPSGSFVLEASSEDSLVLIAGGSGVTPMISLARAALARSSARRVTLLDGNRSESDIIFRDELSSLAAEHPSRFTLRHVLASPPPGWSGGHGILDQPTLQTALAQLDADLPTSAFYLCGPEPMMDAARATLRAAGVSAERIHEERFSQPHLRAGSNTPWLPQKLTVRRSLALAQTEVAAGATLLESALAAGVDMPFSCTMGGCGACKMKLTDGAVTMEEPNCLTAAERADGMILTCVARPNSAVVVEAP